MAEAFGVRDDNIISIVQEIGKYMHNAISAIEKSNIATLELRKQLQEKMEKRWNGIFASIGQLLSKKQSKGAKNRN